MTIDGLIGLRGALTNTVIADATFEQRSCVDVLVAMVCIPVAAVAAVTDGHAAVNRVWLPALRVSDELTESHPLLNPDNDPGVE